MGIPVVLTNVGGLYEYFNEKHVGYVNELDAQALGEAVEEVVKSSEISCEKVILAQKKLLEDEYTSYGFTRRHVELSRILIRFSLTRLSDN